MPGFRLWPRHSALWNGRWGLGLGFAVLSLPVFVAAWRGHFYFISPSPIRDDGFVAALLGSGMLFLAGSAIFPLLRSISARIGRSPGASLIRAVVLLATEFVLILLVYIGLFLALPVVIAIFFSLREMRLESGAVFAIVAGPTLGSWAQSAGDLFVPALVILVFWTEIYFGLLSSPPEA